MPESLSESDTRAKLITPALHQCGWTEEMIRREETPGEIIRTDDGVRRGAKKVDYLLRVTDPKSGGAPVPVALIEAKRNTVSAAAGMEQAKEYARRFNVPFVYSSNGYLFVEYDATKGAESGEKKMTLFPTPKMLQQRYEEHVNFSLEDKEAKPLTTSYFNGDSSRRYYQDAAIRAALEKITKSAKRKEPARVLLNLATGAGKTFIAVHLLKKISDAGHMRRALFLCDRDALRQQALAHFQAIFGNDAEVVCRTTDGGNQAKNARIHIATYQTLGISGDDDDQNFAREHYPPGYFSHIIIDECHRSLRNDWAEILQDNQDAAHIGLTATPKQTNDKNEDDREISTRNLQYFGEPVYVYSLAQGAVDGYLALCEIDKSTADIDKRALSLEEVMKHRPKNFKTGELLTEEEIKELYEKNDYENILMLPDRVEAMCGDLFDKLTEADDPHQKTIIFCVRREHAELVERALNNRYAAWCEKQGRRVADPYAFVCMSQKGGERLADFRSEDSHHFAAVTVDLLTTGVDIPAVRNIVFFCYLQSPIRLQQMIGRGARIDETRGKLSFAVYDYTNATDLLDEEDWTPRKPATKNGGKKPNGEDSPLMATIDGLKVSIQQGEKYIVVQEGEEGRTVRLNVEEYRRRLVERLMGKAKTLGELREAWADPTKRRGLMEFLRGEGYSPDALAALSEMHDYDNYDILAESAYGMLAMPRRQRAAAFGYKNEKWLNKQPQETVAVLRALVERFAKNGIAELENHLVFDTPEVKEAGGVAALSEASNEPSELLQETKQRLFAA